MSSLSLHPISSSSSSASASHSSSSLNEANPPHISLQERISQVKQIISQAKQEFRLQYNPNLPNIHLDKIACPITLECMTDPLTLNCGHTFNRSHIEDWMTRDKSCPICKIPITSSLRVFAVVELIESLKNESAETEDLIPTYSHFQELHPTRAVAYLNVANSFTYEKDPEEALNAYRQAFRYTHSSAHYAAIPPIYARLGDIKKAAFSLLHLGLYQLEEGKIQEAIKTLNDRSLSALNVNSSVQELSLQMHESSKILEKEAQLFFPKTIMSKTDWANSRINHLPSYSQKLKDWLAKDCVIWPGKKRRETHIVVPLFSHVDINDDKFPVLLGLSSLNLLDKSTGGSGIEYITRDLTEIIPAEKIFHFGVMTKYAIPGSADKSYDEQLKLLPLGYEMPTILNAARAILWENRRQGSWCFPMKGSIYYDEISYTRCKETTFRYEFIVGGFSKNGLQISEQRIGFTTSWIGVAGWQTFSV